jgi:hypothetical protein
MQVIALFEVEGVKKLGWVTKPATTNPLVNAKKHIDLNIINLKHDVKHVFV